MKIKVIFSNVKGKWVLDPASKKLTSKKPKNDPKKKLLPSNSNVSIKENSRYKGLQDYQNTTR